MYHYQSLWNNRQSPGIYDVFRAVHGTDKVWVSLDRANLKTPENPAHPEYDHKGMIHWDTDITKYPDIPFHVQGVLALEDTSPTRWVPVHPRDLRASRRLHQDAAAGETGVPQPGLHRLHSHCPPDGCGRSPSLDVPALARKQPQHVTQGTPVPVREHEPGAGGERGDAGEAHRVVAHQHPSPGRSSPGDPRASRNNERLRRNSLRWVVGCWAWTARSRHLQDRKRGRVASDTTPLRISDTRSATAAPWAE